MRRRLPRRQGVVYGPLAREERSDSGAIMGRMVGGLVVLAALAVLVIAGFNFLGGGGGGAVVPRSPSPTAGAASSPTQSPSPTARPTPTASPSATPSPTSSPTPTASPTQVAIEVREGPGFITFGSNYRTDPARIVDARVEFDSGERIAWMADLGGAVGSNEVAIIVVRLDDGTETTTFEQLYEPNSANSRIFLRRFRNISQLIEGPGVYAARYLVNGEVRAEGFFRVDEG